MASQGTDAAGGGAAGGGAAGSSRWRMIAYVAAILALVLVAGVYVIYSTETPPVPAPNNSTGEDIYPVPGNPDLYIRSVSAIYENGTRINLTENRKARDPAYGRLISFLRDDPTEYGAYVPGHACSSFAVELHDHAELSGISGRLVLITLRDAASPHMVVAFNTTDRGTIYVDDTGLTPEQIDKSFLITDRLVTVEPGCLYTRTFLAPYDDLEPDVSMGVVESVEFLS